MHIGDLLQWTQKPFEPPLRRTVIWPAHEVFTSILKWDNGCERRTGSRDGWTISCWRGSLLIVGIHLMDEKIFQTRNCSTHFIFLNHTVEPHTRYRFHLSMEVFTSPDTECFYKCSTCIGTGKVLHRAKQNNCPPSNKSESPANCLSLRLCVSTVSLRTAAKRNGGVVTSNITYAIDAIDANPSIHAVSELLQIP